MSNYESIIGENFFHPTVQHKTGLSVSDFNKYGLAAVDQEMRKAKVTA